MCLEDHPLVLTPFLMRPTFPWNHDAQGFTQTKELFDAAIYSFGVNYLRLPAAWSRWDSSTGCPPASRSSAGASGKA